MVVKIITEDLDSRNGLLTNIASGEVVGEQHYCKQSDTCGRCKIHIASPTECNITNIIAVLQVQMTKLHWRLTDGIQDLRSVLQSGHSTASIDKFLASPKMNMCCLPLDIANTIPAKRPCQRSCRFRL